jgi:hypothetical protein
MTVALAFPTAPAELFEAFKLTAYVPAGVPDGAPFPIVTEVDCPGLNVTEEVDSDVDHPAGSVDAKLIVLEAQADESLFVTATV